LYQRSPFRLFWIIVFGSALSACAAQLPEQAPRMAIAGDGYVPAGYREFCTRQTAACGARWSQDSRVHLDQSTWSVLVAVNNEINRTIMPATDQQIFGTAEFWTVPSGFGDCEDYAIAKQLALQARGIPDAALSIATALEPGQGMHAVLMVRTDRGDFVLDNKTSRILSWNRTPYQWISRQSARHAMIWERPAAGDPSFARASGAFAQMQTGNPNVRGASDGAATSHTGPRSLASRTP